MVSPVSQAAMAAAQSASTDSNALYGQAHLAGICEAHIAALFAVSPAPAPTGLFTPPPSPPAKSSNPPPLIEFIAYALYRTRLPESIVYQSLLLLERLKQRYPSARGTASSPHRLFLAALMLSSKMAMDDTYSNKSWAIVGGGCFALREVNQMERELFAFLGCNVHVDCTEVEAFTRRIEARQFQPQQTVLPPSPPHSPIVAPKASPQQQQQQQQQRTAVKRRRTASTDVESDRASRAADAALALLRPLGRSDAYAASRHVPVMQTDSPWASAASSGAVSPASSTLSPITQVASWPLVQPTQHYHHNKIAPTASWPLAQRYTAWQ